MVGEWRMGDVWKGDKGERMIIRNHGYRVQAAEGAVDGT